MADVATKNKSMSVVSNNTVNSLGKTKMSDVCGVQSNNGLIDLDHNGLSNASNNKLITLCGGDDDEDEEDLILAKNTRNELDSQEDKSLQELIESELALRISANNSAGEADETDEEEHSEMVVTQPEITKKIILQPREDPVDVNAEFIVNEIDHYTLIGEPYEYSNGHVSPDPKEPSQTVDPPTELENDQHEEHDEEEVFDGQTETTETEVTTTTSGPSLPSAFEATAELEPEGIEKPELQQFVEDDQPTSVNTLSDSCVVEETTDEDSSKELSNKSVISADKYLLEEELVQPKESSENLISVEEQLQKSEDDSREEVENVPIVDDIEGDEEKIENEIVDDEGDVKLQENSEGDTSICSSTFIENEIKSSSIQENGLEKEEDQEVIGATEDVFEHDDQISSKEASGVDEKACSFYSTENESCGNIVDNDESIESIASNRPTVDVTDYKLKPEFAQQEQQLNSWMTVEEAVKESASVSSAIDIIVTQGDESLHEKTTECSEQFYSQESHFENYLEKSKLEDESKELAPLATPDEISDISNACDDVSFEHYFCLLNILSFFLVKF